MQKNVIYTNKDKVRNYKFCTIHNEEDSQVKFHLYTDFNDVKAINFDEDSNDVKKVVFLNYKNIENILSDKQHEVIATKKYWQERLEKLKEYLTLAETNLSLYREKDFKNQFEFMSTLIGSVAFSYGIANSTYNTNPNKEANQLLWSLILGGLSFECCREFFEDRWKELSLDSIRLQFKKEVLKEEKKLFANYDMPKALYYNILFESLEESPNKDKITKLNKERDTILKKQDEFSYDVEKFVRVR